MLTVKGYNNKESVYDRMNVCSMSEVCPKIITLVRVNPNVKPACKASKPTDNRGLTFRNKRNVNKLPQVQCHVNSCPNM